MEYLEYSEKGEVRQQAVTVETRAGGDGEDDEDNGNEKMIRIIVLMEY